MTRLRYPWQLLMIGVCAGHAWAHCNPIIVSVVDQRLTLGGGMADPVGFAGTVYVDADVDCGFMEAPGDRLITDSPGYNINGMTPGSGLYLEPLGRTALVDGTPDKRWFWFWDGLTHSVGLAPHTTPLRVRSIRGFGSLDLPQAPDPPPAPIPLLIAEPLGSDLGEHIHIVRFQLDGITSSITGAYGVFARLTSPAYERSDPFLIVVNSQLSAANLTDAAIEINALVGGGDFDADGDHTCADIDMLVAAVATHSQLPYFDLNGDDLVDLADVDTWLARAGAAELPSQQPYRPGDANLDGAIDGLDFVVWNAHKFSGSAGWCGGDFNADGFTDGLDFSIWNAGKFTVAAVPEPSSSWLSGTFLAYLTFFCRRRGIRAPSG